MQGKTHRFMAGNSEYGATYTMLHREDIVYCKINLQAAMIFFFTPALIVQVILCRLMTFKPSEVQVQVVTQQNAERFKGSEYLPKTL